MRKRVGAVALAVHSVARLSSNRTRAAARVAPTTADILKLTRQAGARDKKEELIPVARRGRKATSKVRAALRMNAVNVASRTR